MQPLHSTDLATVFIRAAAVIQTNGHHRNAFVAPACIADAQGAYHVSPDEVSKRPVDVVGAIRIACGLLPTDETSHDADAAIEFAGEHLPGRAPMQFGEPDQVEELAGWNDFEVKSAQDVVGRLLRWSGEAAVAAQKQVAA